MKVPTKQAKSGGSPVNLRKGSPKAEVSARKLAAGLWQLHFTEVSGDFRFHFPNSHQHQVQLQSQTCIRKQPHKIEAMLDGLKEKLARERASRERTELLNIQLVRQLARANISANQFMALHEREKKQRHVTEQVCSELGMQIEAEKAKVEELRRDSMKYRRQVEQEMNMFQTVMLWREESIQMKLADAKLAVEDMYSQMIQLIGYLQACLRSRSRSRSRTRGDEHDDLIKFNQAAESVKTHDLSKSDDDPLHGSSRIGLEVTNIWDTKDQRRGASLGTGSEIEIESDNGCAGAVRGARILCNASGEGGFRHSQLLAQRSSAGAVNPHVIRGMKGLVEWPRSISITKTNSKAVTLEARVRSQKSQLQHILKPKP